MLVLLLLELELEKLPPLPLQLPLLLQTLALLLQPLALLLLLRLLLPLLELAEVLLVLFQPAQLLRLLVPDGCEEDTPERGVGGERVAFRCLRAGWLLLLLLPLGALQWSQVVIVIDLLQARGLHAQLGFLICLCCTLGLPCETVKITWDACYWERRTQQRGGQQE